MNLIHKVVVLHKVDWGLYLQRCPIISIIKSMHAKSRKEGKAAHHPQYNHADCTDDQDSLDHYHRTLGLDLNKGHAEVDEAASSEVVAAAMVAAADNHHCCYCIRHGYRHAVAATFDLDMP